MRVAALFVGVLVLAGCAAGKTTVSTVTRTVTVQPPQSSTLGAQATRYFGEISSLTSANAKQYLLVLKPQSYLVGVTANVAFAAQQGKACAPLACPGVEDDRLVVPAGTQPLTFVLPAKTTGTVLTLTGTKMHTTTVTAAQLSALFAGAKKPHLVEPLVSGVWLAVDVDTITSFAQQFEP
jgi:hypothetical protein